MFKFFISLVDLFTLKIFLLLVIIVLKLFLYSNLRLISYVKYNIYCP